MNILITICARGGSKGVKGKNFRKIAGKPLMAYTIETAKKWGKAKRIVCSTDSQKIADIAKKYGAETPFMRPDYLATDTAGKVPVIRHALIESEKIFGERFDIIVDLDVTSPVRTVKDLDKAFKIFMEKKPDVLFSVVKARKNPYFNMIELNKEGFAELSKKLERNILRRQDAPKVYEANASIYFYSRDFLLNEKYNTILSSKRAMVYVMDSANSIDIDNELDFRFIEFLLNKKVISI
ncbi:MAG: acylneuraminate cytidylyltransferase family protein [Candidatus Woesearchaeota archaeon]|nr:acylneuraminate cytidylyltransferase family protein [Candidatus Woesearchaeota archaeon]